MNKNIDRLIIDHVKNTVKIYIHTFHPKYFIGRLRYNLVYKLLKYLCTILNFKM